MERRFIGREKALKILRDRKAKRSASFVAIRGRCRISFCSGETREQKEIRRLKRSLEIVVEERDILKKAMAIFSSPKKRDSLL